MGIVGNAYIDLTKEERQYRWYGERLQRPLPYLENFMPLLLISLISAVDESTRYRYRLNKPVVFTYSFSQKNALVNYYGQMATLQRMGSQLCSVWLPVKFCHLISVVQDTKEAYKKSLLEFDHY
ncbi:hypothetical protein T06_11367, partial [Trichinella sp. T6]